jgi:hypothetical protein
MPPLGPSGGVRGTPGPNLVHHTKQPTSRRGGKPFHSRRSAATRSVANLDELKTSIFHEAEGRDPLRWSSFKYDPVDAFDKLKI